MATWTFSSDEAVRDYLAGQALVGFITRGGEHRPEVLAEQAYRIADAMMQERKKVQDRA